MVAACRASPIRRTALPSAFRPRASSANKWVGLKDRAPVRGLIRQARPAGRDSLFPGRRLWLRHGIIGDHMRLGPKYPIDDANPQRLDSIECPVPFLRALEGAVHGREDRTCLRRVRGTSQPKRHHPRKATPYDQGSVLHPSGRAHAGRQASQAGPTEDHGRQDNVRSGEIGKATGAEAASPKEGGTGRLGSLPGLTQVLGSSSAQPF